MIRWKKLVRMGKILSKIAAKFHAALFFGIPTYKSILLSAINIIGK